MNTIAKTHISLNVHDIDRAVAFYEAFFGVSAHKRRPGYANFDIENPPLKLAMQQGQVTAGAGTLSHLGIVVHSTEEVAATKDRLESTGVVVFREGDTVCCFARQDKVWVTDPDGNSWEVYALLDEMNETEDDHFDTHGREAETGCCGGTVAAPVTLSLNIGREKTASPGPSCCE
ncbi:MAG: ArsI/CadI family heavy metal resistance metalloenzyme [Capsulimonadales bacterium]|nr:ArsI/CadI family heavy metal resistance metalloenzyme [Capsulimonadales bacterium]